MTWLKVDDKLTFHAKIVRAKNAAVGAWVRMGAWCAERESDGVVPADVVELIASPAELGKLLEVELLHARPDGSYEIHDYLKYNPSRAQLQADRARWSKNSADRRRVSRDTSEESRECPGTGTGTGSGSLDRGTEEPDGDSHRASSPRLKSVPPPPPEPPRKADSGESPYDMARRVFSAEWKAKFGRDYAWSPRQGQFSDDVAMRDLGRHAVTVGKEQAESFLRKWTRDYLRDKKAVFVDEHWPARFCTVELANKYDPPTGKPRVAAKQPTEPVAPALSPAEVAAKLGAIGIGKIGVGGGR